MTLSAYRLLLCLLAVLSSQALVASPASGYDRAARQACQADYQRFCASVTPGQGRILKCLGSHLEELAPACKAVVTERLGQR
jgi:hypothetical protein